MRNRNESAPAGRSAPPAAQRGAALIVALLVVAMVVMLGTTLSSDFLLMFRRVENQLHSEQAYAYLLGAEGLARAALLEDMQRDGNEQKFDYLTEGWAQELRLPTDYGWIGGHIEDAQGRFNLNTLGVKSQGGQNPGSGQQKLSLQQVQFIRLLRSLPLEHPLEADQAQALTEAIGDWVDEDDEITGFGGAEIEYYTHADPPGRPANRDMVSPSELMWVKGMTADIYRLLAPLVTVWPGSDTQDTNININTAPPGLLACLGDDQNLTPLGASEVEQIVHEREQRQYFKNVEEVRSASPSLQSKALKTGNLAVRSNYFILNAQTEFQGRMYSLHSLLYRDDTNRSVRVIERTFGDW